MKVAIVGSSEEIEAKAKAIAERYGGFEFPSISKARQYVRECWDRPYTIIPKKIKHETKEIFKTD